MQLIFMTTFIAITLAFPPAPPSAEMACCDKWIKHNEAPTQVPQPKCMMELQESDIKSPVPYCRRRHRECIDLGVKDCERGFVICAILDCIQNPMPGLAPKQSKRPLSSPDNDQAAPVRKASRF